MDSEDQKDRRLLGVMGAVYGVSVTPADLAQLEQGLKEYSGQQKLPACHPGVAKLAALVWNSVARAWNKSAYGKARPLLLLPATPGPWDHAQNKAVEALRKRLWDMRAELVKDQMASPPP